MFDLLRQPEGHGGPQPDKGVDEPGAVDRQTDLADFVPQFSAQLCGTVDCKGHLFVGRCTQKALHHERDLESPLTRTLHVADRLDAGIVFLLDHAEKGSGVSHRAADAQVVSEVERPVSLADVAQLSLSRWLEAEDSVLAGRNPDRATAVIGVGKRRDASGNGRSAAAAGAAGGMGGIPGVASRAVQHGFRGVDQAQLR